MASVIIKNATFSYNKLVAVDNLSMEIRDGEFVALLGPSASGKSTVLKMIAGLINPASGEIIVDGNKNISAVFQNSALLPSSVFSNIALSLKLDKFASYSKSEIEKRVVEAARLLEIESVLNRNCMELSGGQRQRVALARAFVRRPEVFLMDEPLNSLDSMLKKSLIKIIKELHNNLKTTFIYITHDSGEAARLGERIAIMNGGRLIQFDTLSNILTCPANNFVREFMSD